MVLLRIAARNLLRRKGRTVLLGSATALGAMVLIMSAALSRGISGVLYDRIVSLFSGHVNVSFYHEGNPSRPLFRDRERVLGLIKGNIEGIREVRESINFYVRAIGHGSAENCFLYGVDTKFLIENGGGDAGGFRMLQGELRDLLRTDVVNPVVLPEAESKLLNAGKGDTLHARFFDLYGRNEAIAMTVVGICKPVNAFMNSQIMFDVHRARRLLGYEDHDVGSLNLSIGSPRSRAEQVADSLHALLKPPTAVIDALVSRDSGKPSQAGRLYGFRTDSSSVATLRESSWPVGSDPRTAVLIPASLARRLGIGAGDTCRALWSSRFGQSAGRGAVRVTGIIPDTLTMDPDGVFVNEADFYRMFHAAWPVASRAPLPPNVGPGIAGALCGEWLLLPRARDPVDLSSRFHELRAQGCKATVVEVTSMYQSANQILQLEGVLGMVTMVGVLLLFVVIQTGVVNTVRIGVRERTIEIGTLRSIGLQRGQLLVLFMLESIVLSCLASVCGLVAAYAGMAALSVPQFDPAGPLGMILHNGRIPFAPTPVAAISFTVLITGITAISAYFPARRAARLSPAEALRHTAY